jgi:hypothetical protein
MTKPKAPQDYDHIVERLHGQYQKMSQFRKQLDAGSITLEDLKGKARARALEIIRDRELIASRAQINVEDDLQEDAEFRESRVVEYEKAYGEWDDAGDYGLLVSLVELETVQRAIRRDLSRATTLADKEKYWKALRENTEAQKGLQQTLGIDKKSRDSARAAGNPMDNWDGIKDEVGEWVDMLVAEFVDEAQVTETEQDLRDLMKYKLSWPFGVVDSIVYNVKRLNGIGQEQDGE